MRWQQTVPNDPYIIRVKRPISSGEIGYLIHLYQPLIGVLPVALYQTLYHSLSLANFTSAEGLHRTLMVTMAAPLNVIMKARHQLEAIGLLETYRVEAGEQVMEYTLNPPYSPDVFFADDTLSIMLLNRVGKQHYRSLRRKFAPVTEQRERQEKRERITKAFDEVFYHLSPSEITVEPGTETDVFLREVEQESPLEAFKEYAKADRAYSKTVIDFALLEALVPKSIKNETLFTKEVCYALQELAFLYHLNDQQLAYFLQEPSIYSSDNTIDVLILRRNVKDWYRHVSGGQAPRVNIHEEADTDLTGMKEKASRKKQPILSRGEDHNRHLSSLSPLQLLSHYHNGAKVAPADQKIVEDLLEDYQLPFEVVNVLLEYVMLTHERQLPKALIYKIAAHWKRLNINTVQQAQLQAKQLYAEHKGQGKVPRKKNQPSSGKSTTSRAKETAKDKIPELILEQLERQKKMEEKKGNDLEEGQKPANPDYEKKRQRVQEMLKAMEDSKQ
ncbi:DnaD domain protein [Aneurinibacillus tyrosinisolvens]|uniref:DnaD domain protein n=1 Tax=Aneurinibacillus tyrosinisolvens TaxID=1443435 RepID=UPI00063EDAD7|nr:DnaD domain protein [Aneurinibacillus tyrosinisolvens]